MVKKTFFFREKETMELKLKICDENEAGLNTTTATNRKLNLDLTRQAHSPDLCIPTTWRIYDYMEMIYMVRCERSNITRAV